MSVAPPAISVVVPTYRRRHSVGRLLDAFAAQTLPTEEFEIVVSIDGSDDGTLELVQEYGRILPVRATWQPNQGRAGACNAGIAESRGALVVILDDDMEPVPGFLAAHLTAHRQHARRVVLGAVPVVTDDPARPPATFIRAKFERHDARLAQPAYRIGFRDFYTGNCSLRAELLREVGAFDPGFTMYGNEDSELGFRLVRAGADIVYCREAAARQHYEKDFAALARDNVAKGKTAVFMVERHPETFSSLRLAHYRSGSRKRRLLRAALLRLSGVTAATPRAVIWTVRQLERRRSPHLHRYYRIALDYFFWLGAKPLLDERTER